MAEKELESKQTLSAASTELADTPSEHEPSSSPGEGDTATTSKETDPSGSSQSDQSDPRASNPEVMDAELESVRPLPPSLRLKTAQDSTSRPMKVQTTLPPVTWPPKAVADIMTRKVITVQEHEPIGELEEWMQRFKFHHLPVVDKSMKLIGLISLTDYLHSKLGIKPDCAEAPYAEANPQAGSIMRKNVVFARVDSHLSTACRVMLEKNLTCLPVVEDDGTLVGILTKSDFVKLAKSLLDSIQLPTNKG